MTIGNQNPVKIASGKYGSKQVVLQNNNAALASNLRFGNQPSQLLSQGTVLAPGGTTPQLTISGDLWVQGETGNVDLQVIF
jgi:hypothetical protein